MKPGKNQSKLDSSQIDFLTKNTESNYKKRSRWPVRISVAAPAILLIVVIVWGVYQGLSSELTKSEIVPIKVITGQVSTKSQVQTHSLPESEKKEFSALQTVKEFQGLKQEKYASNIDSPLSLAFGNAGELYVTTATGHVLVIYDENRDGLADRKEVFATGFDYPLGLEFSSEKLYVTSKQTVSVLEDKNQNGLADIRQDILTGLPTGARQTLGLAFGPEGKLYIGQGAYDASKVWNGKILRAYSDGEDEETFAEGFYNPFDLAFHPKTEELFVVDSQNEGSSQFAELNVVNKGGDYGWPDCLEHNCGRVIEPIYTWPDDTIVRGLVFYDGDNLPKEFDNNLFVVLARKNNASKAEAKVVRLELNRKNYKYEITATPFANDFIDPVDVVVGPKGALYVSDYGTGEIIKISAVVADKKAGEGKQTEQKDDKD